MANEKEEIREEIGLKQLWPILQIYDGINADIPKTPITQPMNELKTLFTEAKIDTSAKNKDEYVEKYGRMSESIGVLCDTKADAETKDRAWKSLVVNCRNIKQPEITKSVTSKQMNDLKIYRLSCAVRDTVRTLSQKDVIDLIDGNTADIKATEKQFEETFKEQIDVLDKDNRNYSLVFRVKTPDEINSDFEKFSEKRENLELSNKKLDESIKELENERAEYIKKNDPSDSDVKERNLDDYETNPELSPKTSDYKKTITDIEWLNERSKNLIDQSGKLKEKIDTRWNTETERFVKKREEINKKISEYSLFHESLIDSGEEIKKVTGISLEPVNTLLGRKELESVRSDCKDYLESLEGEDKAFYKSLAKADKTKSSLYETKAKVLAAEERVFGVSRDKKTLDDAYNKGKEIADIRTTDELKFADIIKDKSSSDAYEYFKSVKGLCGPLDAKNAADIDSLIYFADAEINNKLTDAKNLEIYKQYETYKSVNEFSEKVNDMEDYKLYMNLNFNIEENKKSIEAKQASLDAKKQESEKEKASYEESKRKEYDDRIKKFDSDIAESRNAIDANSKSIEKMSPTFEVKESYDKIAGSLDNEKLKDGEYIKKTSADITNANYAYIRSNFRSLLATKDFVKKSGSDSAEYRMMIEKLQKVSENVYADKKAFVEDMNGLATAAEAYITAKKNQFWRRSGSDLSQSRMSLAENISYFASKGAKQMNEILTSSDANRQASENLAEKQGKVYQIVKSAVTEKHKDLLISGVRKEMELSSNEIQKSVNELSGSKTAEDVLESGLKLD